MEQWDIYDKERVKTGETMVRGSKFEQGQYHLVVHICIFNSEGKMLIQQRQPFKEGWPNMWDITVGGSALAGESSSQAAERELLEEIGYKADLSNKRPYFTINFYVGFDDYYIIEEDVDIKALKLQYEEVKAVKWATEEEILQLMAEEKFVPYHLHMLKMLFEIRKQPGALAQ